MTKFSLGDTVVYVGDNSNTGSMRSPGDSFVVEMIFENVGGDSGPVYYPTKESTTNIRDHGEYEVDLRLATKLDKALE